MYGCHKDEVTYAYLGLVVTKDLLKGKIRPSYIMCQSEGNHPGRAPWRIVRIDGGFDKMARVMVTDLLGNDDMVDFFSAYRRRDHGHTMSKRLHDRSMKYYPEGALFWFECNVYGEETGVATYIKAVPDKEMIRKYDVDSGFSRLKERWNAEPSIAKQIGCEPSLIPLQKNDVKKIVN